MRRLSRSRPGGGQLQSVYGHSRRHSDTKMMTAATISMQPDLQQLTARHFDASADHFLERDLLVIKGTTCLPLGSNEHRQYCARLQFAVWIPVTILNWSGLSLLS